MTDNLNQTPVETPVESPAPAESPSPAPVEDPVQDPAQETEPAPEIPPVEVVSVDELLQRLAETNSEVEDKPQEEATAGVVGEVIEEVVEETIDQIRLQEISTRLGILDGHILDLDGHVQTAGKVLSSVESHLNHPLLTTPFENYSVMEGLLLLLLVFAVVKVCVNMVKGAFSWLL